MIRKILKWTKDNFKQYMLVSIIFIIGLFFGVIIVNNIGNVQMEEISAYIDDFITNFQNDNNIDKIDLVVKSMKDNLFLALILWLAGTTIIGIPIVLIIILMRGVILGLTISTLSYSLGTIKGILFCFTSIFLHNILFIPAILTIGVSSINLYKTIIKNKKTEKIKIEIIRHTGITTLMIIALIISSCIENIVSVSILQKMIKYF